MNTKIIFTSVGKESNSYFVILKLIEPLSIYIKIKIDGITYNNLKMALEKYRPFGNSIDYVFLYSGAVFDNPNYQLTLEAKIGKKRQKTKFACSHEFLKNILWIQEQDNIIAFEPYKIDESNFHGNVGHFA